MAEEPKDKAEEKPDIRKSREYKRFRRLLKQVVKAPPLREHPLRKPKKQA